MHWVTKKRDNLDLSLEVNACPNEVMLIHVGYHVHNGNLWVIGIVGLLTGRSHDHLSIHGTEISRTRWSYVKSD